MKKLIVAVLWFSCTVFDRGYLMGGFTMMFPGQRNVVAATAMSLLGPMMLPFGTYWAVSGAPYMWHGYTCQQRWAAWDGDILGVHYFSHEYGNWDCVNFKPASEGQSK